ncbi:unnamed protein product [Caretta caretta]
MTLIFTLQAPTSVKWPVPSHSLRRRRDSPVWPMYMESSSRKLRRKVGYIGVKLKARICYKAHEIHT